MSENHTDTVSAAPPEASLGLTPAMAEAAEIPSPWNEPSADLALPEENADAMPTLALTAAGLAVLNVILTFGMLAIWTLSPESVLQVVRSLSGLALLLAVAPIAVGGMIFSKNRQNGKEMPGTVWATWAIVAGVLLFSAFLFIPLVSAIVSLTQSGGL